MAKLTIIYDPHIGTACPDGEAMNVAKELIKQGGTHLIGSNLIIEAVRVLAKRGEIPFNQVEFEFGKEKILMTPTFQLTHWPRGFCDHLDNLLMEIIDWNNTGESQNQ